MDSLPKASLVSNLMKFIYILQHNLVFFARTLNFFCFNVVNLNNLHKHVSEHNMNWDRQFLSNSFDYWSLDVGKTIHKYIWFMPYFELKKKIGISIGVY